MKKYWIIVALVGLLSACIEEIVDITGTISGTVKDYTTGQTVGNCQVTLSPALRLSILYVVGISM